MSNVKKIFVSLKNFLIFDIIFCDNYIAELFATIHNSNKKQFPHWNFSATRKKVIADYWFRQVLLHYTAIILLASFVLLISGISLQFLPFSVLSGGLVILITMTAFNYWPNYYSNFLPKLDTIIAEQEKIQNANEEIKKCKRTQFSIPSLTIIFYVFTKSANIPFPACNNNSAELLNNLYGADKDKLKQNLSRLYKLALLSAKERAEMQKAIDISRKFFENLDHAPAQKILDQLELKLQSL